MQSLIRTGYAALGCLAILLIGGTPVTIAWLWSLPGVAILLLISPAIIVIFATAGAFFPDLEFIVSNLIRVSIFLTPVFWFPSPGFHQLLYTWNPLTYFIEAVREPIVAGAPPIVALDICSLITLACWVMATVLLGGFRKQIVFLL
jgi:ABC-type polysaccharide/polyol phosphate export permease